MASGFKDNPTVTTPNMALLGKTTEVLHSHKQLKCTYLSLFEPEMICIDCFKLSISVLTSLYPFNLIISGKNHLFLPSSCCFL